MTMSPYAKFNENLDNDLGNAGPGKATGLNFSLIFSNSLLVFTVLLRNICIIQSLIL